MRNKYYKIKIKYNSYTFIVIQICILLIIILYYHYVQLLLIYNTYIVFDLFLF